MHTLKRLKVCLSWKSFVWLEGTCRNCRGGRGNVSNYVDVRASRASELVWAVHTVATCGSCDLLGITCECKEMAQREPVVEDQRVIGWWLQHAASQGLPRPGDQDQWPSWPSWPSCPTRAGKQTAQAPAATNWSRQLGGVGLCDLLWLHASLLLWWTADMQKDAWFVQL